MATVEGVVATALSTSTVVSMVATVFYRCWRKGFANDVEDLISAKIKPDLDELKTGQRNQAADHVALTIRVTSIEEYQRGRAAAYQEIKQQGDRK